MNRPFDIDAIRNDFPILAETVNGKPLAFLDSAASAQKPRQVIDAIENLYAHSYANIHRGIYKLSQDATEAYEKAREAVAKFINAENARQCLFLRNTTEGVNLVAQTWARNFLKAGDEILLTELEHHSNIVPWQLIAEEKGLKIKAVPITDAGEVLIEDVKAAITERTKLVAVAHISNAIGTTLPVREIVKLARDAGAKVLIDGSQAAPHIKVDVQDIGADFYVFTGHKVYGPTGVGVLYGREELLDAMPPYQGGGDMIETVTFAKTTFNELPHKFEAGTPNIAGGIGLHAAIDYVNTIGFEAIGRHEHALLEYATKALKEINSVRLYGTAPGKAAIISFCIDNVHSHDVGTILDHEGIAVRTGHHCAQPLMDRFGITGTVRASFGMYNTKDEVDRLVSGVRKTLEIFA